jgi:hypothetical protein
MKSASRVTFSEPLNIPDKREDCDESLNEKLEAKVERRLHLTFANGMKNRWARRILRDLNDPLMSQDELVNFELFIIGKLTNDIEDRYLIHGDWIKKWVNYLTLDSEIMCPVENGRLLKKILKPKDVVFTVNQHIWSFLKLHHGVGNEFTYSLKDRSDGANDPELWIQVEQDIALNTFLECPPWFIEKVKEQKKVYKRREIERQYYENHQETESEVKYVVPQAWFSKYRKYVFEAANNNESGPPENLDNSKLYNQINDDNLILDIPYVLINEPLWQIISNVYEAKHTIAIKKLSLRVKSNRVIEFETWTDEIEIRRRRKNLEIGVIHAEHLSYDTRELLCLENIKAQTIDLDESEILFKADEAGGFGQAVKSIRSFV